MKCQRAAISLLLATLVCLDAASAYFITVDSYTEECFFEKVEADTSLVLSFEIADGGFQDIRVRINDADGRLIANEEHRIGAYFTFKSRAAGPIQYCFDNTAGSASPKLIVFNIEVQEPGKEGHHAGKDGKTDDDVSNDKLTDMITELGSTIRSVKQNQEYMEIRDRVHREISEHTNSSVVWWSVFEFAVMVVLSAAQIFYLKRFFEVKAFV
ncbi:transmembrane emp24 domain-containing protein 2-like [Trichogramma pretiosum]|uniref:transmembrane emp24 domain-containing protein 2-like n=1 Tax=Trichogramma pretiosum TaxID=7493 RepID=UPI0006C987A2|nr:transmembrane emp24 domain-containing protein 2-like [Trichogramma pretiosum]